MQALEWMCRDPLYSVKITRRDSPSIPFANFSSKSNMTMTIATAISQVYRRRSLSKCFLRFLQCPLSGFITALRAAALVAVSRESRHTVALYQYLFLLFETFVKSSPQKKQQMKSDFPDHLDRHRESPPSPQGDVTMGMVDPADGPNAGDLVKPVTLGQLRGTAFLPEETYQGMQAAEEFCWLESGKENMRVVRITALFLGATFEVVGDLGARQRTLHSQPPLLIHLDSDTDGDDVDQTHVNAKFGSEDTTKTPPLWRSQRINPKDMATSATISANKGQTERDSLQAKQNESPNGIRPGGLTTLPLHPRRQPQPDHDGQGGDNQTTKTRPAGKPRKRCPS